jgi:hypothetical protein
VFSFRDELKRQARNLKREILGKTKKTEEEKQKTGIKKFISFSLISCLIQIGSVT